MNAPSMNRVAAFHAGPPPPAMAGPELSNPQDLLNGTARRRNRRQRKFIPEQYSLHLGTVLKMTWSLATITANRKFCLYLKAQRKISIEWRCSVDSNFVIWNEWKCLKEYEIEILQSSFAYQIELAEWWMKTRIYRLVTRWPLKIWPAKHGLHFDEKCGNQNRWCIFIWLKL